MIQTLTKPNFEGGAGEVLDNKGSLERWLSPGVFQENATQAKSIPSY